MLLAVAAMVLTGCDQASMINKMMPPKAEEAAKNYIELLGQHRFEDIENNLDRSIVTPETRDMLSRMAQMIPAQQPKSIKVVGLNVFSGPNVSTVNITFQYEYQSKWLLINVATQKKGNVTSIIGFNVSELTDSLENINRFKLTDKTMLQYTVLVLAITVPIFCIYALVMCIRTRMERRKWLWVLFVLFGVAKLSVNWTTGEWAINLLSINLLGVSALAPAYGPWIISVSLPLGAIIFLLRRKNLLAQQDKIEPLAPINSETP
jgi:hypothetical protein